MDRVRVGLAGIGRHGIRYARHIRNDMNDMELSFISRASSRDLPEELKGVEISSDIFKEDLDLLIIATPTDTHHDLISKGLKRDMNILVEKPVVGNREQCLSLLNEEKESQGTLTVAQTLRYTPVLNHLKERLVDFGPIRWFEIVQSLEPPKTPWLLEERAMGGCVLNTGVHVFDTVNWLISEILYASCMTDRILNPVWEDHAYGNLTLRGGIEGCFRISRNTNRRSRFIRVDLKEGFLWADSLTSEFYHVDDGVMKKELISGETMTLIALLQDMVKVVNGEMGPPITALDGIKAVSAALACYDSHGVNNEIRLKSYQ